MNAALLLSCGLFLSQVPSEPVNYPELQGTYSVLVKTTLLGGGPAVIGRVASTAPAIRMDGAAEETAGHLAPVPPLDSVEPADISNARLADTKRAPPEFSNQQELDDTVPEADFAQIPDEQIPAPALGPPGAFIPADAYAVGQPGQTRVLPAVSVGSAKIRPSVQLLRAAMTPPERGGLGGSRVRLRDLLVGSSDRHAQLQVVSAYWQLSAAVVRYHDARDSHDWLAGLREPEDPRDIVRLEAARTAVAAALREAELAVVSMQYGLAEMTPQRSAGIPILPADEPFAGEYQTHFESLFSSRPAPAGLLRIHHILPLRLAAIDARAAAVDTAINASRVTELAYEAGEASLNELLRSMAELRAQREAFSVAVRDYNIDIAAYALAVAGENVTPETLVSMLIAEAPQAGSVAAAEYQAVAVPPPAVLFHGDPREPTLAMPPAGTSPAIIATGPPDLLPVEADISTTPVPTVTVPPPPPYDAVPEDTSTSPFRDVTPSDPARPEVLVPTPPARHRTPKVPGGAGAVHYRG
jgi:hypothetical protein